MWDFDTHMCPDHPSDHRHGVLPCTAMHHVLSHGHQSLMLILEEDAREWCIRDGALPAFHVDSKLLLSQSDAGTQQQNKHTPSNSSQRGGPGQQPAVPSSRKIYQEINYCSSISTQKCLFYPNYFIVYNAMPCAIKLFVYRASKVVGCRKAMLVYRV